MKMEKKSEKRRHYEDEKVSLKREMSVNELRETDGGKEVSTESVIDWQRETQNRETDGVGLFCSSNSFHQLIRYLISSVCFTQV